MRLGEGHAMRQ